METDKILFELAKIAPVVGVLIWVTIYFKAELKTKNEEIKELNNYIRENDKNTLITMGKLIDAIDGLKELIKEKLK